MIKKVLCSLILVACLFFWGGCSFAQTSAELKAEAEKWLKAAQEKCKSGDAHNEIWLVRDNLGKANCSLDAICSSEEKVGKILRIGYKNEALYWLKAAREKGRLGQLAVNEIWLVKSSSEKALCSSYDIGTTPSELQFLETGQAEYLVQPGDTFSEICKTVLGSGENKIWLKEARKRGMKPPYKIFPGERLVFTL